MDADITKIPRLLLQLSLAEARDDLADLQTRSQQGENLSTAIAVVTEFIEEIEAELRRRAG